MITLMLLVHGLTTPFLANQFMPSEWWAAFMTLCVAMSFWSLYYISLEIEQPFGDDVNDFDVRGMQDDLNGKLQLLMDERVQTPPHFQFGDRTCVEGTVSQLKITKN